MGFLFWIPAIFWTTTVFAAPSPNQAETHRTMDWQTSRIKAHLVRLAPGQNLLAELTAWAKENQIRAASIVSAVGSLKKVTLRFANQPSPETREGHFEVIALNGMLDSESMHLHAAVSLPDGTTLGGHLMGEAIIYTTLELSIAEYEGLRFTRKKDETYGYPELHILKEKKPKSRR